MSSSLETLKSAARRAMRLPFVWRARWRDRRVADTAKYPLAVCTIFRDEAPFLAEWIEFHRGVGVGHFYLYDNFSKDNWREVLAPHIAAGLVTVTPWPVPVGQIPAYEHCLAQRWHEARWIALIDVDEFLFSPSQVGIVDIIDRYRDLPGLHVWHAFYGSSGLEARPTVPQVEAFTMRAELSTTTVKAVVNPRMVYKPGVHLSKYWSGEGADTARRPTEFDMVPVLEPLRINHYWSRSLYDLNLKVRRGDASQPNPRNHKAHFDYEKKLNAEKDEAIVPIARAIRAAAGK